MTVEQIVLLGIIQGLTEFLPVSSSAHLVFAQAWLHVPEATALPLDVFLHLGTVAAALWLLRAEVARVAVAALSLVSKSRGTPDDRRLLAALAVGTVPAAIAGVLAQNAVAHAFGSARVAAAFLLVTALILASTRFAPRHARRITVPRALAIGLAQAVAILPGISRSGSTIATGIWLGVERHRAARFSFLLSIPVILGAAVVELPHLAHAGTLPPAHVLAAGFIASLVAGVLAIQVVLRVVGRGRFEFFALYCLVVGALVLFQPPGR